MTSNSGFVRPEKFHPYMVVSPMAHVAINASVCVYLSAHKLGPRGVFCSGKQMLATIIGCAEHDLDDDDCIIYI